MADLTEARKTLEGMRVAALAHITQIDHAIAAVEELGGKLAAPAAAKAPQRKKRHPQKQALKPPVAKAKAAASIAMPTGTHIAWTDALNEAAVTWKLAGHTDAEIGKKLGRSDGAVSVHLSALRKSGEFSKLQKKIEAARENKAVDGSYPMKRRCAGCSSMFMAASVDHVKCKSCAA